jgi:hypothetical protein
MDRCRPGPVGTVEAGHGQKQRRNGADWAEWRVGKENLRVRE